MKMSENLISIKCVLLGETAVGKSSFINRFISDTFLNNYVSTSAGCCSTKKVVYEKANKTINYEIWDTAGQEKYRSINKIFYQDAAVVILVYDITRKDSFEALKNYWYTEVKDNSPKNVIIVIAANKSDLYEYEEITEDEGNEFATSINAIFQQTSAASGDGIQEIFDAISCKILSPEIIEEVKRKNTEKNSIKLGNYSLQNKNSNKSNFNVDSGNQRIKPDSNIQNENRRIDENKNNHLDRKKRCC